MTLVFFLIVFAVAFGLLMYGAVRGTNAMLNRTVVDKHRALEEIVNTGRVPGGWSEPYERKISRLRGTPGGAEKAGAVRARANRRYLKNLDALTRYVENSRLVQGEDTRQLLLARISGLRSSLPEDAEPGRRQTRTEDT